MTEIEIRGKLDKKDFERLFSFFEETAKLVAHYKRLSVDLSPGFDPKLRTWPKGSKFDLRIKKSDKEEKISLKIGDFHLKERKEIDVKIKEGEFVSTLEMFNAVGFERGMVYFWESWEFSYKNFEVKLSKYSDEYYTWEIESKSSDDDPDFLAKELRLKSYSEKDYREAIDWENKNIHNLYSEEQVQKLLEKFN